MVAGNRIYFILWLTILKNVADLSSIHQPKVEKSGNKVIIIICLYICIVHVAIVFMELLCPTGGVSVP